MSNCNDEENPCIQQSPCSNVNGNLVVNVSEPYLNLYEDLNEKLLEIRSKRDAVLLSHKDFKKGNDIYNKLIIYLSLLTAFFETVKAQLHLTERNDFVAPMSIIAPIFLSTLVSIISALLKFKKFPEKMEELIKASEKCNFTILRMRKLLENMSFQPEQVTKNTYNTEVMTYYRESLDSIEKSMYPNKRSAYFEAAQTNLIKIHNNELQYNKKIHNIRIDSVDLEAKKLDLTIKERQLFKQKRKEDEDGDLKCKEDDIENLFEPNNLPVKTVDLESVLNLSEKDKSK